MTMLKVSSGAQALETLPRWTKREIRMPLRRSDIRVYQLDDEAVLFDHKTDRILLLNQTALAVFRGCDGQSTMRRIAESLAKTYELAFDYALDHIEQLVALFADSSLLDVEDRA